MSLEDAAYCRGRGRVLAVEGPAAGRQAGAGAGSRAGVPRAAAPAGYGGRRRQVRAGAQRVHAVEALHEAPGHAGLAEGPGVVRAVVAQVGRGIQARIVVGAQLDVVIAAHARAVGVVGGLVPRDEPLLEQQSGEFGARLDDVQRVQQLERLAGVVGLALQKVVARAAPQVLGFADVEGGALVVAHHVHAGSGGQRLRERDLVVVAARPGLAEARHLLEGAHALLLQPAEEEEQELGRGLRVLQGAVHGLHLRVEAVAEGLQGTALLRAELARQAQRVERRAREGAALQAAELVVEEAEIEVRVVGDEHGVGGEAHEARQHHVDRRRVGHGGVVDAGDAGDHRGDTDAGVDERREGGDFAPALEAYGADLGDLGEARRGAGGLEVDHGERHVGQVAARGVPRSEADVHVALPRKALVALHDVGDQLAHELGRAVDDGEEARPDIAVVEGFARLLEQSEEVVDRGEGELHGVMVNPEGDGCTGRGGSGRRLSPTVAPHPGLRGGTTAAAPPPPSLRAAVEWVGASQSPRNLPSQLPTRSR